MSREDYMKVWGYTKENITWILKYKLEFKIIDIDMEDALQYWFNTDHLSSRPWGGYHRFEMDGAKFIAREFTHDNKRHTENFVVGIERGKINRDNGVCKMINISEEDLEKTISVLEDSEKWHD